MRPGPVPGRRDRGEPDRGAVTVEAAWGVGSIVAVFLLVLAGMSMVIGQLRCTDAAIEAARLVARGEQYKASEAMAELAPAGAKLAVSVQSGNVRTEVTARPLGSVVPGHWLKGRAFAVMEPGLAEVPPVDGGAP